MSTTATAARQVWAVRVERRVDATVLVDVPADWDRKVVEQFVQDRELADMDDAASMAFFPEDDDYWASKMSDDAAVAAYRHNWIHLVDRDAEIVEALNEKAWRDAREALIVPPDPKAPTVGQRDIFGGVVE